MSKLGLCKYLYGIIFVLMIFHGFTSANTLSVESSDGLLTGKYFCPVNLKVQVNRINSDYGNCQYGILFNHTTEKLFGTWNTGVWNNVNTGFIETRGALAAFRGDHSTNKNKTSSTVCSDLVLTGISTGVSSTKLDFVNSSWSTGIVFGSDTTADGINASSNGDTLTGVKGITIAYETCPCTLDNQAPVLILSGITNQFNGGRITGQQNMSLLIYDRSGSNRGYWFNGKKELTRENYVSVGSNKVDNQEGVNSGSIKVTVKYKDPAYNGKTDDVFTLSNRNFNSIVAYNPAGSLTYSAKTWDSNDRGYWITFKNTSGFLVEKEIEIIVEASDNTMNLGYVCKRTSPEKLAKTFTFNQKTLPTITWLSNTGNLNPDTDLKFRAADDWAGIDTGKIYVTIPEITGLNESGDVIVLLTGYTYSGSDLQFTGCTGKPAIGNSYSCDVIFHPISALPVNTGIRVNLTVYDQAGNLKTGQEIIYTRNSCSFYGCRDDFFINYFDTILDDFKSFDFEGWNIIITGSDNIQILDHDGYTDTLMCGDPTNNVFLSGNIKIFDENGNEITGDINISQYTGIYLTGLDVSYNSGVIRVED